MSWYSSSVFIDVLASLWPMIVWIPRIHGDAVDSTMPTCQQIVCDTMQGLKPVSFSISNTHKIIFQPLAEELLASLVMAKGGGSAGGLAVDVLLTIVQIIVFLYDVISYPVYMFLSRALSQVTLLDILPNLTFCNNSTPLCWLLILTCHLVLKHTDFIKRIFSCYVQFIAITFKPTLAFVPDLSFQSAQHNNTGQCHNSRYGSML